MNVYIYIFIKANVIVNRIVIVSIVVIYLGCYGKQRKEYVIPELKLMQY